MTEEKLQFSIWHLLSDQSTSQAKIRLELFTIIVRYYMWGKEPLEIKAVDQLSCRLLLLISPLQIKNFDGGDPFPISENPL